MTEHLSLTTIPDLNGRFDLYGNIHKAIRKAGCELLCRLGAADYDNADERAAVLAGLRGYLAIAAGHVVHEDEHVHKALQARGASTATVDDQHDDHRQAFRDLEALAQAVEQAGALDRSAAGRKLYLAFAAYIAEDLAHMHEEETVTAPALWKNFTDQELIGIEMRIVSSIPPEKHLAFMRTMIPALNPAERAALLGAMKRGAPPEIFNAVIEFAVRPSLSEIAFDDLANRLCLAA
ncbi:hemerythrin domain-containing protein [Agrobacterium sp. ES01]|uniref:hemerythrin domain-containing protein n=1 Tax=Agrobacterium sp. ES01 TaxID=3420714 RepID=UPI003D0A38B9